MCRTPVPLRRLPQGPTGIKLRYMVRQPIFDRDEKVFGYELLFRDDMENAFYDVDPDIASRSTLDSSCW